MNSSGPTPNSQVEFPEFPEFIGQSIANSVGRERASAEIDDWLADTDAPRFFIITGEPGIGKTDISVRLIQICQLDAYHFCAAHQVDTDASES